MGQGSTFIKYGYDNDGPSGVTLYRVVTQDLHQEQVFDESHTDLMYFKTTIRISGFLHGHSDWTYLGQLPIQSDGDASSAHMGVRYQLPPRHRFQMIVGATENTFIDNPADPTQTDQPGQLLFDIDPAPTDMIPPPGYIGHSPNIDLTGFDVANGPRCLSFVVTQIGSNEVFRVEATFEINSLWCDAEGNANFNTYGVLSNRWSVQDSLDVNMRTTRTYTGVLVLASANINAQWLRWILAPPLQPLFRRDHMDFQISADGLKIRWMVTDVEIAYAAPFPARKWSVIHKVRAQRAMMGSSTVTVTVEGDSIVNKADLITICLYVITNRIFAQNPLNLGMANPAAGFIVENIELTDYIGDVNMITATAEVSNKQNAINGLGWILAMDTFGKPITAFDNQNPPQAILPGPLDGTNGGVGANAPYNTPTNQQYNPSISWGGYAGQVPQTEGPARAIGVFACFLQSPCNDDHGAFKPGYTVPSQNSGSQNPVSRVPYTANVSTSISTTSNPLYSNYQSTASYKFWQIDNVFKWKSMNVAMPIASSAGGSAYDTTTLVLDLAPDQVIQIIRVHGERLEDWPEFFDPRNVPAWPMPVSPPVGYTPIVRTYLRSKLKPGTPTYMLNGAKMYRATMEIYLALSRAPTPPEQLGLGNDKWTNKGPQSTTPTLTNSSW